jgi:hypothetical protein
MIISAQTTSLSRQKYFGYRVRVLGYERRECEVFRGEKGFTVHTNARLFKQYLRDMRIMLIEVID